MLLEFLIPKSKFDFFSFFFKKADVTTLKKFNQNLNFNQSLPGIINSNKILTLTQSLKNSLKLL